MTLWELLQTLAEACKIVRFPRRQPNTFHGAGQICPVVMLKRLDRIGGTGETPFYDSIDPQIFARKRGLHRAMRVSEHHSTWPIPRHARGLSLTSMNVSPETPVLRTTDTTKPNKEVEKVEYKSSLRTRRSFISNHPQLPRTRSTRILMMLLANILFILCGLRATLARVCARVLW